MNSLIILTIIESALKLVPGLVTEIRDLVNKGDPTPEDWAKLREKVAQKAYEDYIIAAGGKPPPK
jgi:hypothetical protein